MKLIINGQQRDCRAVTLADLLKSEGLGFALESPEVQAAQNRPRIALARNGALVRREAWDTAQLVDGDAVEIVTAVGGG